MGRAVADAFSFAQLVGPSSVTVVRRYVQSMPRSVSLAVEPPEEQN
jgi:hypothetical protein